MHEPANIDVRLDALVAHASWVRRLARGLVGEEGADDLAQDVWVRALDAPPEGGERGSVRAWLRRVLVNRARELRRGEARRAERQRAAARPEALPDPLERLALHRELVERVAALEEPWRRTIVLRYFEDLAPSAIAEREGVPLSTVTTRLARGRELLREALDRRHGGERAAWCALLAPLARGAAPAGAAALPAAPQAALPGPAVPAPGALPASAVLAPGGLTVLLAMKTPLVLTGLAAAALAAFLVLRPDPGQPASPSRTTLASPAEAPALEPPSERAAEPPAEAPATAPRRTALASEEPAPAPAPASEAPGALAGRVVDPQGNAMAGLAVWLAPGGEGDRLLGTSAADGSFAVDAARDAGPIEVRDARYGTVLGCRLAPGSRSGPTLVVAPWIAVGGLVRAEDGEPIEGAQIVVEQPKWLSTESRAVLDYAVWHEPVLASDGDGRFALERTLAVEGTLLRVDAHGFEPTSVAMPEVPTQALEIVLRRPDDSPAAVRGQVVDARGRGVGGAWVSLGYNAVRCDADGGFRVDVGHEGEFDRLLAVSPGTLPALLERPRDAQGEPLPWPSFVTLTVRGEPLTLAGRVVDAEGAPLAGWKVWLADPTFFSHVDQHGIVAEGMLRDLSRNGDGDAPSAAWPWTRTDADGRFELVGLLDREYALDVYDLDRLLLVRAGPFAAGRRDARVVVDLGALVGPVAGRVVDPDGRPLAGVAVESSTMTYVIRHEESGYLSWGDPGPTATTDEEGRFRFEALPRQRLGLHATHPDVIPRSVTLGEEKAPDPEDVTIVCERRYHLRVETDQPGAAWLEAYDAEGERVMLNVFSAGGHMATRRYQLVDGKSEALSLADDARTIALFDGQGNELARRPLDLAFGVLNQMRF